ncbi:probable N-acetyltransferase 14 [Ambystoma mexicanum]|uniref:probable N-acetyltransferase 14 n=1 Tax=Ambystoma mexicanum TaxID=8296 RepID=UPI0037E7B105
MPTLVEDRVSVREMREEESQLVLEMLKDGFKDTENRLILYVLTRPMSLLILAVVSSGLRFLINSFIAALLIPVLVAIVILKLLLWRSPDLKRIYSYYTAGHRKIWVAVYDEDDICGCVALEPTHDRHVAELKRLSVSRWYRRLGVASCLVRFFETHARNKGFLQVVLHTPVVSKASSGLFEKCGYKKNGGWNWLGYTIVQEYSKDL